MGRNTQRTHPQVRLVSRAGESGRDVRGGQKKQCDKKNDVAKIVKNLMSNVKQGERCKILSLLLLQNVPFF